MTDEEKIMRERTRPRTVVCVKQVPVAAAVEFDVDTGTLRRDGVPSEVNTHDVRALLSAVEMREARGGEVVVLTMGPPDASQALRYCLALGADRAVHLCDRAFAGSDTLATARALALAIGREEPDLVLCGRSSTDAETGNVGPEIAEFLSLPQITSVCAWEFDERSGVVLARRDTDDGFEQVTVPTPVVLIVGEDVAEERFPAKIERAAAEVALIERVDLAELGADASLLGSAGSPTVVNSIAEQTAVKRERVLLDEEDCDAGAQADAIVSWLSERGPVDTRLAGPGRPEHAAVGAVRVQDSSIAVYVEIGPYGVKQVSRELLAAASRLADDVPAQVDAVLIGVDLEQYCAEAVAYGADRVIVVEDERFARYDTLVHTDVVADVIRSYAPRAVLFPSTTRGRDLAPRCAARLELGLTADCVGLHIEDGRLIQHKPAFGDGMIAMITSRTSPELATLRPGVVCALEPRWDRPVRVDRHAVAGTSAPGSAVTEWASVPDESEMDITEADIVIGVGMGAMARLPQVRDLAALLGAAVACTRKVADTGALPRQAQIGLTGHAISPRIYIVIGARGAYEHVVGIGRAEHVLAIDIDEDSVMFDHADLGVIQDCEVLLPLLIARISETFSDNMVLEEQCIRG
jgi:electron transfer flavoprotein alpha subunit